MSDCCVLMSADELFTEMMAFAWFNRNWSYFIETIVSLEEGEALSRQIWHQVAAEVNADAHMVYLDIY